VTEGGYLAAILIKVVAILITLEQSHQYLMRRGSHSAEQPNLSYAGIDNSGKAKAAERLQIAGTQKPFANTIGDKS